MTREEFKYVFGIEDERQVDEWLRLLGQDIENPSYIDAMKEHVDNLRAVISKHLLNGIEFEITE